MIDVHFARSLRLPLIVGSALLIMFWGLRRLGETLALIHGDTTSRYTLLLGMMFGVFAWQWSLSWREHPYVVTPDERQYIKALTICVNVPVYNEDPELLEQVLTSLFAQSRRPNHVEVVDDGSIVDYSGLRARSLQRAPAGMTFTWVRTENRGKRHAQMETFATAAEDILITMDSDTVLHSDAIEEGLKPFSDPQVTAVAGLVLALNKHRNLLTRLEDLVVTTWQLTLRSAYSHFGSVTVNSGPFALYRSFVVQQARDGYLKETIAGRPVQFSDDSLLTLYALMQGRTVQQPSAVAFSAWPEKLSHHVRQQVRWTRGTFIRSLWRLRYLPLGSVAFWLHLLGHAQFLASTIMLALVVFLHPEFNVMQVVQMLVVAMFLAYAITARTLIIRRSDETVRQQLGVYALSPLVVLWAVFMYRPLRLFGMVTCFRTGWGTRQAVEMLRAAPGPVPTAPILTVVKADARAESESTLVAV